MVNIVPTHFCHANKSVAGGLWCWQGAPASAATDENAGATVAGNDIVIGQLHLLPKLLPTVGCILFCLLRLPSFFFPAICVVWWRVYVQTSDLADVRSLADAVAGRFRRPQGSELSPREDASSHWPRRPRGECVPIPYQRLSLCRASRRHWCCHCGVRGVAGFTDAVMIKHPVARHHGREAVETVEALVMRKLVAHAVLAALTMLRVLSRGNQG